jgi:hypothetical protein
MILKFPEFTDSTTLMGALQVISSLMIVCDDMVYKCLAFLSHMGFSGILVVLAA